MLVARSSLGEKRDMLGQSPYHFRFDFQCWVDGERIVTFPIEANTLPQAMRVYWELHHQLAEQGQRISIEHIEMRVIADASAN